MMSAILFILVVSVLLIIWQLAGRRSKCGREERLRAWADTLGLRFETEPDVVPEAPYRQFSIFRHEGEQTRLLTIFGQQDVVIGGHTCACELIMGDIHQVDDGSGELSIPLWYRLMSESDARGFSYLLLRLPFDAVPSVRIRHRRGSGGFGVVVGWDLLLTEWARFNRKVQVASRDKRFASNLIANRMMEFLIDHPSWPMTIEGGWIMMTDTQSKWTTTEYRRTLEWMREFLNLWPEHLVDTMSGRSSRMDSMC